MAIKALILISLNLFLVDFVVGRSEPVQGYRPDPVCRNGRWHVEPTRCNGGGGGGGIIPVPTSCRNGNWRTSVSSCPITCKNRLGDVNGACGFNLIDRCECHIGYILVDVQSRECVRPQDCRRHAGDNLGQQLNP